jgi:peptidoglycan L-alanyl-D-glutamate endopeptidase CwlK
MAKFSSRSLANLATCHKDLQILFARVFLRMMIEAICGQRGREQQEAAVRNGKSRLHFPDSAHNSAPSMAMDVVPLPINWNDIAAFEEMGRIVLEEAEKLLAGGVITHKVEWGGNWKMRDYPHVQLVKKEIADA